MDVNIKKVFQELIVPELKEIKLDQKNTHTQIASLRNEINSEFRRVDEKIDSFRSEMKVEIGSLRNEVKAEIGSLRNEVKADIGSLRNEMRTEIRHLDEKLEIAIQVRERLAALESRVVIPGH